MHHPLRHREVQFKSCFMSMMHRSAGAIGAMLWLSVGTAWAAVPAVPIPNQPDDFSTPGAGGAFGFLDGIERSNYLLGDLWGLRTGLSHAGMSLGLEETSEYLGNVSGGTQRGFAYDGLSQAVLQLDTQRAFNWHGGTVNASGLWIHGSNLSANNLDTLQTASGIEGDRAVRLWELWYQQKFLEEDRLDVKIGQQSLDQEFMVSANASYFVNTMFGWPMLPSADLPGGGPAYPLSALGIRFRAHPINPITVLVGVFSGSPVRDNSGDPQQQNAYGTSFPLNGGALAIAEIQYAYPSLGTMVLADDAEHLSCLYRLGVWYDSERFADLRYDTTGRSLADPASNGTPRTHHGDYSIYAVVDQMLYRFPNDADRNVNLFLRAMDAPQGDRNLVTFCMNAGLVMHEPIFHRDDDTCGLGMGYARVGAGQRGFDQDTGSFSGTPYPVQSGETYIEATYQYQALAWWQLQPDVQYVINPGAGVPNPSNPGRTVRNELVIGIRTNVLF